MGVVCQKGNKASCVIWTIRGGKVEHNVGKHNKQKIHVGWWQISRDCRDSSIVCSCM